MKTEWQPIETAPRDGNMFLMYITGINYRRDNNNQKYKATHIKSIIIADYDLKHNCFFGANTSSFFELDQLNFEENYEYLGDSGYHHIQRIKATHWMPLSQPPINN